MLQRRYLLALGLIVLSLLLYFAMPAGPSLTLKMLATRMFSPVLRLGTNLRASWDGARHEFQSRAVMLEENRQLRAKLALQMQEGLRAQELEDENRRLRDMVGFRKAAVTRLCAAHVIGRDPSSWWKTVFIDAGSEQGVRPNLAVITPAGLVGKTVSVTGSSACVLLIVDPNCKVAALVENSRDPGIVEGAFAGLGAEPLCRLEFINRDARIAAGNTVITSGLGGVFPKGIRIGSLEQAPVSESGLYKSARVRPSADLERLEEVFVILN